MDRMDHLRPEIAGRLIAPIDPFVQLLHRDEHGPTAMLSDKPPSGILNGGQHSLPLA
jgi:hypothetical protein